MARGSIEKRGKGYSIRYYIGKKLKRESGFKTKKEAEKALIERQAQLDKGTYVEPTKTLYKDFLMEWLEMRSKSISPQTYSTHITNAKKHIIPEIGDIPLTKLNAMAIQRLVNNLSAKGYESSTIKRIVDIVSGSLNYAEKMDLIVKNPCKRVEKPKIKKKEASIWDKDQILAFLRVAEKSRYYMAFLLALMTGMRQGEVLGLRWKDVDFDNKVISIRQTLSHDGKSFQQGGKTKGSVRSINISDVTVTYLKKHRKTVLEEKLALGADYKDYDLVVCTSLGTPINPSNVRREMKKLAHEAGVPLIKFHEQRHTHASHLIMQGVNAKIVSERLGHSKVQMTLDTYSHLLPNMQADVSERFESSLFEMTKKHDQNAI